MTFDLPPLYWPASKSGVSVNELEDAGGIAVIFSAGGDLQATST